MSHQPPEITHAMRAEFERDGVICVRQAYDPKRIAALLEVWDEFGADPKSAGFSTQEEEGRVVSDGMMVVSSPSSQIPLFRSFIEQSNVPAIVGALTRSKAVGHYWDTIFTKDAGSPGRTNWHHDAGASAVKGNMLLNAWTPLTPATRKSGIEFIAGSHKWGVLYWPRSPNGRRLTPERPLCPDFEDQRDDPALEFLGWDTEPGDVVIFHPRTCHFNGGNPTGERRVALATWWYGDDVVWDPRPESEVGHADEPYAKMTPGGRPGGPHFPILWEATAGSA
jgi:ectoine hydroxylase-related dioxygenase (phytanoyl-CoA dioxygenase family)